MLTLYHNGDEYPIQSTEYYIRELASGLNEVIFDISIYDPIYAIIAEEENIRERDNQYYLVKQIDAGADTARIICQLDLDAWRAAMYVTYDSGSLTVAEQINAIKPQGWTVQDHSGSSIRRTIKGDLTPYEICVECTGIYGVYIRWDNKANICHIYTQQMGSPVGAFATRELNLKEINYKGKSIDLATRLYAYGKDGLSFASINGGKPYVDSNAYDSRIICAYWQDDRYTDAASLLADATAKVTKMAIPERSYECSIVDLQATNPELYNNLDFSLFKVATLIDDVKNTAINYQVVERHVYPYHPDDNEVIFDNSPQKITAEISNVVYSMESPNSDFQQIQKERIEAATNWLVNGDGYVVAVKDADGTWKELLFMDTDDITTAQDVLRINKNGIGFSTNGINGPYANAWTIDGNLIADFITTGTMLANRIRGGTLELGGFGNSGGVLKVLNPVSLGSGTYSGTYQSVPFGYSQAGAVGIYSVDVNISDITDPTLYKAQYIVRKTVDGSTFTDVAQGELKEGVNRIAYDFEIVNDGNVYYYIGIARWSASYTSSFNWEVTFNKPTTIIDKDGIKTGAIYITGGTLNINNNFTVDQYGYMTAKRGYIGNGTYGFAIEDTYIANQLTSVYDTSQDGAYYGINGMAVNAAGKHSHVIGGEIVTQGTLSSKRFTIGDNSVLGVINGRFNNVNGLTIQTTPDSSQFALLQLNVSRWVPWTGSSDRRLKKNIKTITADFIRRLFSKFKPVSFIYKNDADQNTEYGLIAQDLEETFNEENIKSSIIIELEGKGNYKAINYQKMVGLLIPAIKDLYERVDVLEKQVEELQK